MRPFILYALALVMCSVVVLVAAQDQSFSDIESASLMNFINVYKQTDAGTPERARYDFLQQSLVQLPDHDTAATTTESGITVVADYTDEVCRQQFSDSQLFSRLKQLQGDLEPPEDHAFRDQSVFIFSHTHISVDSTQDQVLPADQRIQAPTSKQYTRFVFRLAYNMDNSPPNGNNNPVVYTQQFKMTGSATTPCSTASKTCNPGQSCQAMQPVTVTLQLSKQMSVLYGLERFCSGGGGANGDACLMPFSYLPDDRPGGGSFVACNVGADPDNECTGATDLLQTPTKSCIPSLVDFNATAADLLLEESCNGEWSDEWSGWSNTLNTNCNVACCTSECDSDQLGQHMRWAIGPLAEAYSVLPVSNILGSLSLSVSTGQGAGTKTRQAGVTQLQVGSRGLDSEQDVRVTVNRIFHPMLDLVPDLTPGFIVVWNWAEDDALSSGPATMVPDEPTPPNIIGLTPSIGAWNLATGTTDRTYGWAYINSTRNYGTATYQYGQTQQTVVSSFTGFGTTTSCSSSTLKYYSEQVNVPGWNFQLGAPDSICRISAYLTRFYCMYAAATASGTGVEAPADCVTAWQDAGSPTWDALCSSDALEGWWYMPPGMDMNRPNFRLNKNYLEYDLTHLGDHAVPAVAMCRYVTKKGLVSAAEFMAREAAQVALEVYVDVSADFAGYAQVTNQAFVNTELSSCVYNATTGAGLIHVAVENDDPSFPGTFTVNSVCDAGSDFQVTTPPADVEVEVPKTFVAAAPQQQFQVKSNVLVKSSSIKINDKTLKVDMPVAPTSVICQVQLYSSPGYKAGAQTPLTCTIFRNVTELRVVEDALRKQACRWYHVACKGSWKDQPALFYVIIALVISVILGFIGLMIWFCVHSSRERKRMRASLLDPQSPDAHADGPGDGDL